MSVAVAAPTAWERLQASPLMARGGWLTTRLLSPRALAALTADAAACAPHAEETRLAVSPDEATFRGNPARWLDSAAGGPALAGFYRSPALTALFGRLTGLPWEPTGEAGSWSYYGRAGQFLDLHRDIDACDLALITCVYEAGAPAGLSGVLRLWPERVGEPLAAVRRDPERGRVEVRLRPGESLVLLGGAIPHRLEPMAPGHVRVVAPLCFQCSLA